MYRKIADSTLAEINQKITPEELERRGVVQRANDGKSYVCPVPGCNNGTHKPKSDGIIPNYKNGAWLWHCFSCGKGFNNFQVCGLYYGLDTTTDFRVLVEKICTDFGIQIQYDDNFNFSPNNKPARKTAKKDSGLVEISNTAGKTDEEILKSQQAQKQNKKLAELIHADFENSKAQLLKLPQKEKRGLTDETLKTFQIGVDFNWTPPQKRLQGENSYSSPRVIIPHLLNSALPQFNLTYCAALFQSEREHLNAQNTTCTKYLYCGNRTPFGLNTLTPDAEFIAITEGEFDALSIWQAIGGKFPCLATGGTADNGLIDALKKFYSNKKPRIIFFADNEKAGIEFARSTCEKFIQHGFSAVYYTFADSNSPKVDANKILVEQGNDKLADIINKKIELAQDDLKLVAAEMEKESALKEKITDWKKRNGEIENLDEVKEAAAYLQSFTVDKINSTVATESKTIQALAKCKYYDFYQQVADDFLARVLSAKAAAKEKVKTATAENPVADSARMTAGIEKKEIVDAVKKAVTAVEKKHLKYQQAQEQRRLQEEYQQRKQEMQIKNQGLLKRLKEFQKQPPTPARNAEMQEIILELCEWNYNKRGEKISVKSSMANYDLIFTYDPFVKELFGYEEFSKTNVFLKTPLWGKRKIGENWTDSDDSNLRVYLRRTYTDICGEKLYYDVFNTYSVQNSFNVVHNYFNNLPDWDKEERAETLFSKFLSVQDTEFTRAVTMKWLLAAVARIFYPGCNFQAALVLQGNQNIGKSYILEKLGGAWYGALIDNVEDTHAVDAIKNLWIVEMKEFSAARKAEINAVKSFIERAVDNHRGAYAHHTENFKRHCVFAISVNDKQFLRDLTGNRRYWILESPLAEFKYIDGLTPEYIQQIWAEIFYKFKELTKDGFNDKILELPLELKIQAENIAEKFTVDDGLQKEIPAFLDILILPPVLWKLLTKEEKRKFFAKGYIELDEGDWNTRRKMLKSDKEKQEFDNALDAPNKFVRHIEKKFGENSILSIAVYGSYTRQETCAAEIYNEFSSGSDKRKQIFKINDVLAKLENWKLSDKQNKNFNGYGNQKNIYRRIIDTNEKENLENNSMTLAQDSNYYVEEVDVPF